MDEVQYWEQIQLLRRQNDQLASAVKLGTATQEQRDALKAVHNQLQALVGQLRQEYQVLLPNEAERPGWQPYAVWFQRVAEEASRREYSWTVCSGCCFSKGRDAYVWGSGVAPCRQFAGNLYFGDMLNACPRLTQSSLTPLQLLVELYGATDTSAVEAMRRKEDELGTPADYRLPL